MLKVLQLAVVFAALAIFPLLAGIAYYSSPPTRYPRDEQSTTEQEEKDQTKEQHTIGGFIQFMFPDAISIFTFWLVLATFGLALVAVIQIGFLNRSETIAATTANAAKKSAGVAEDTLIATQRPWVSVKIAIGPRGLFFDEGGANLDLVFLLKNTGNSPAVNVRIEGGPRIDIKINDRIIELEKICAYARQQTPHPKMWGYTIFPKDTLTLPMIYTFENKDRLDKIIKDDHGYIDPIVIGCIDYFITFGEPVHHQSRFVYTVDYPSPGGGMRAIKIDEGNKAATLLRLSQWQKAGSFHAD